MTQKCSFWQVIDWIPFCKVCLTSCLFIGTSQSPYPFVQWEGGLKSSQRKHSVARQRTCAHLRFVWSLSSTNQKPHRVKQALSTQKWCKNIYVFDKLLGNKRPLRHVKQCKPILSYGYGSKRKPLGTAGFGLFFLLPIGFSKYPFLTHSHISRPGCFCQENLSDAECYDAELERPKRDEVVFF